MVDEVTRLKAAAWDALQELPPGVHEKIEARDQAEHIAREIARSTLQGYHHDASEVLIHVSVRMLLDLCNVLGVDRDSTKNLRDGK